MLQDRGLDEQQIESLIVNIDVHCFKRGLTSQKFVGIVNDVCTRSDSLAIAVDKLPDYLIELKKRYEEVVTQEKDITMKKDLVLQDYNRTKDTIEDYTKNKPLYENYKLLQAKLEEETRRRWELLEELNKSQMENIALRDEFSVPKDAIELANRDGKYDRLTEEELLKIAKELLQYPNRYMDLINIIKERSIVDILDIDPNNVAELNKRGRDLFYSGRYQEALEYFDKSLEMDPENSTARTLRGYAVKGLNQTTTSTIK
jgi:tetratricopeptide (TPR) repeat protein